MAKTSSKYSFYMPVPPKPKPPPKPAPVIPYVSGGYGGLAQAPIYTSNENLNRSGATEGAGGAYPPWAGVAPPQVYTDTYGGPPTGPFIDSQKPARAGKIRIGGKTFDYDALLAGDPDLLLAGQNRIGDEDAALRARRSAIRRAVVQAGIAPVGASARGIGSEGMGDIDEATLREARENPYSAFAELGRGRVRSEESLLSKLAARGMADSGARGAGTQRIVEGYERGQKGIGENLLDLISGAETSYTTSKQGAFDRWQAARDAIQTKIANDPRYQPIADTDAVLDEASGLYMTPDGRWFNADGSRA